MIYKFIDNNGSEITVNSLSSLQALVDSDTINEDTKVKAGLRGKWTTASSIEGLVFSAEESNQDNHETEAPQGDIKSFITGEETKELQPEKDEYEYVEEIVEEEVQVLFVLEAGVLPDHELVGNVPGDLLLAQDVAPAVVHRGLGNPLHGKLPLAPLLLLSTFKQYLPCCGGH